MSSRYRKPKVKKPIKRNINYKNNFKYEYYSPPVSPVNNIREFITDVDYSSNSLFVSLESVLYGKKINCDYCKDFNIEFYWINPFIKVKVY